MAHSRTPASLPGLAAVAVEPLTVLVTRRRIEQTLDSRKFYDARNCTGVKMGAGVFFPREAIAERMAWQVTDILREVSGVRVLRFPRLLITFSRSGLRVAQPRPPYRDDPPHALPRPPA